MGHSRFHPAFLCSTPCKRGSIKNIWGQCPPPKSSSEVGYVLGCLLPSRLMGLWSVTVGFGNEFWRISKATERCYLHLYVDALKSSNRVRFGEANLGATQNRSWCHTFWRGIVGLGLFRQFVAMTVECRERPLGRRHTTGLMLWRANWSTNWCSDG